MHLVGQVAARMHFSVGHKLKEEEEEEEASTEKKMNDCLIRNKT